MFTMIQTLVKDREVKIKRQIEELFYKPFIISTDKMHTFQQKEMKKIRLTRNTWYDCLSNHIPEPIRKSAGGFKDRFISFFKTNTPK